MSDFASTIRSGLERRSIFASMMLLLVLVPALILSETPVVGVSSDEIVFRKHTIDLGSSSESCAVMDMNRDGRLDIVSSENWYEQGPPLGKGQSVRWTKHGFRKVGYNSFYIE